MTNFKNIIAFGPAEDLQPLHQIETTRSFSIITLNKPNSEGFIKSKHFYNSFQCSEGNREHLEDRLRQTQ